MEMQGSRSLAVTQQQAWNELNNPQVLKACIPGCDKLEASGDNQYTLGMAVKVGPVGARFTGKIKLRDINPPNSYTLEFDGQGGAAGFGKGVSRVNLTPQGSGCELAYDVKAQVGGKIAQVGQRLIDGVARSMAEDFFKRFDAELQKRHPAPATADAVQASGAPGASSGAGTPDPTMVASSAQPDPAAVAAPATATRTGVAPWMWIVGVVVVVAVAWWLLR